MKKVIPALLCVCLLLSGCTQGPEPTPTPGSTPTPTAEPTPTPAPTPVESVSPVYTDWSKLEPYRPQQPIYTRRHEERTENLIPAWDYGPLLSFAGAVITGVEEWEDGVEYYDFHLYGLMTTKGEVVVDPVFSTVIRLEEMDPEGNVGLHPGVMLLGKMFYDEAGDPEERYALCAEDGRWCTDFLYTYSWENYVGVSFAWGIPLYTPDGKMVFRDPNTGVELRVLNLAALVGTEDLTINGVELDANSGWVSVSLYHWNEETGESESWELLFDPDGKRHAIPEEVQWLSGYGDGLVLAAVYADEGATSQYRYGYLNALTGTWAIEPIYTYESKPFVNGVAPVCDGEAIYFINTEGEALTGDLGAMPENHGGYWYVGGDYTDPKVTAVFDEALDPVTDSPLLGADWAGYQGDNWFLARYPSEWLLIRDAREVYHLPISLGDVADIREDRVLFEGERVDEDLRTMILTDLAGNVLAQWEDYTYGYFVRDTVTGEGYLRLYEYQGEKEGYYDLDGKAIDTSGAYVTVEGGLVYHYNEDYTTFTDLEGNVVFHWPIFTSMD